MQSQHNILQISVFYARLGFFTIIEKPISIPPPIQFFLFYIFIVEIFTIENVMNMRYCNRAIKQSLMSISKAI